jgi:hypothetical protein
VNQTIIPIAHPKEAIPVYRTWYDYHGDIFVSVICNGNRKSYIRRKADSEGQIKTDVEMCFWHWDWQYSKIEATYGIPKSGIRTYEIVIDHESEKHRIDSLVNNIAIEFQHSLGVSIEEMNLRFKAHFAMGYIPYLVLDFTDIEYEALKKAQFSFISLEFFGYYGTKQFENKAKKWTHSTYYKNQTLFFDFKDVLVRPAPDIKKYFVYDREKFILSLCNLENELEIQIDEYQKNKKEQDRTSREYQVRELDRKERAKAKAYDNLKNQTKLLISENKTFKYFNECYKDETLSKYFDKLKFDVIIKNTHKCSNSPYIVYHHIFKLYDNPDNIPHFILEYKTHLSEKDNKYQFAEIIIHKLIDNKEIWSAKLIKRVGEKPKLLLRTFELFYGFLHSFKFPAYNEYDEYGKLIRSDYYIFNHKIDNKQTLSSLSDYYDLGGYFNDPFIEPEQVKYYEMLIDTIQNKDDWGIIRAYIQNDYYLNEGFWNKDLRKEYFEYNGLNPIYLDNFLNLKHFL